MSSHEVKSEVSLVRQDKLATSAQAASLQQRSKLLILACILRVVQHMQPSSPASTCQSADCSDIYVLYIQAAMVAAVLPPAPIAVTTCLPWYALETCLSNCLPAADAATAAGTTSHPAGVCGDPFEGGTGPGYWANKPFNEYNIALPTYTAGSRITINIELTANHGGKFGFAICDRTSSLDQACFDRFPLTRADLPAERWFWIQTSE